MSAVGEHAAKRAAERLTRTARSRAGARGRGGGGRARANAYQDLVEVVPELLEPGFLVDRATHVLGQHLLLLPRVVLVLLQPGVGVDHARSDV